MSDIGPTQEITPFLNSLYWDPEALARPPVRIPRGPFNGLGARAATHMIVRFALLGGRGMEVVDLAEGDIFDPKDHAPGTIVYMQTENLSGHDFTSPNARSFDDVEIPARPALFTDRTIIGTDDNVQYRTLTLVQAVASNWAGGKHHLFGMDKRGIAQAPFSHGMMIALPSASGYRHRVKVGETLQLRVKEAGGFVMRTAAVRVYSDTRRQRTTERRREPRRLWMPRPAFGSAGI